MLSTFLEIFLTQISANKITNYFIFAIIGTFCTAIIFSILGRLVKFTSYAGTLMTSLGILGTFIGIVIGLLGFDTNNIDGSIPALLEGLKTAFITSICGLVGAIIFNFLEAVILPSFHKSEALTDEDDITPEHIYNTLEGQKNVLEAIHSTMDKTYHGISGNEEGSLVGQFKMLRADLSGINQQSVILSDLLKVVTNFTYDQTEKGALFEERLFKSLEEFATMLSKSATEQIIEALKNVIEDFNSNLTEQFGENFKALDESVKKLVIWQEQYKTQVEQMSEQYEQSVSSLVETKEAVGGIWKECENIPTAMEQLRDVLETNQHQIAELHRHLEAFVTMRDAAVEAVPTIQGQLDHVGSQLVEASETMKGKLLEVSEDLLKGSSEMKVSLEEGSQHFRDSVTVTQQSFNELAHVVKDSSEGLAVTLKDTAIELSQYSRQAVSEMQEATASMHEEVKSSAVQLSAEVKGSVNQLHEEVKSSVSQLHSEVKDSSSALQNEVKESVSHLHDKTQLISSEMTKVVQDFERVCQEIVEQSARKSNELAKSLNEHLTQSQDTHEKYMNESLDKTGKVVNAQLEQLEKATAREIQKAMEEMGGALVKITGRFVNDYEKMVQAMDQVIHTNQR